MPLYQSRITPSAAASLLAAGHPQYRTLHDECRKAVTIALDRDARKPSAVFEIKLSLPVGAKKPTPVQLAYVAEYASSAPFGSLVHDYHTRGVELATPVVDVIDANQAHKDIQPSRNTIPVWLIVLTIAATRRTVANVA